MPNLREAMNLVRQAQLAFRLRREWFGVGGQPVPKALADARAATCIACPKHDSTNGLEEKAKRALASRLFKVREELQLSVAREAELHLCGLCGCYMPMKVLVPLEHARSNTPDWGSFPEGCWLRTEAE